MNSRQASAGAAPLESTPLVHRYTPPPPHKKRQGGRFGSVWLVAAVASLAGLAVVAMACMAVLGDHDWDPEPDSDGRRLESSSVGRFLHITDLHIDPNYVEGSTTYSQCHRPPPAKAQASSVIGGGSQDGHRDTGRFGIAQAKCDSPVALINATSDYLRAVWADTLDFVVWTGDSGRHDGDAENPRTFDEIIEENRIAAAAMRRTFAAHTPVVPNIGNNDISPHNELAAPGHKRAAKTFRLLADAWGDYIPADQRATFLYGGYYARDVADYADARGGARGLTALSLNTIYWYRANAKVGGCAAEDSPGLAQLAWMRYQMRRARERRRDIILLGHVAPSRDNYRPTCYHGYARTATQVVPAPATQSIARRKPRDADGLPRVQAQLFGHSNVDAWAFVGQEIEWLAGADPLANASRAAQAAKAKAKAKDKRLWWEREVDEETGRFGRLIRDVWRGGSGSVEAAALAGQAQRDWALMPDDPAVEFVRLPSGAVWPRLLPPAAADAGAAPSKALPGDFVESLLREYEHVLVQDHSRQPRLGTTTISPSIIPKYFPSFRVFYYARRAAKAAGSAPLPPGTLIDYDVYWANLPALNREGSVDAAQFFQRLYRFSSVYRIADLSVDSYLRWARKLLSSKTLRKRFRSLTYLDS
ncbi:Endopolyphosphatase [Coemansia interrupta]|uniref:Endopolyphosphatase n=1 Tax=Coemansia interrupta TaxID=1126814 RepID=A0A9W8H5J2_9FUNG|nr:Endopolyphosphatase [Coemansia interrupta]